jgi:hypothetical protein
MYLDPGFGSMILQIVLAGLLGIGVFLRIFWKRITGIFRKNENDPMDIKNDIDYGDTTDS